MTARVMFTAGFSPRYTGGVRESEVEAKNLRGVIREMDKLYPGLGHHLEEETTVAIDGQIHETAYFQPVPPRLRNLLHPQARRGIITPATRRKICRKSESRNFGSPAE